MKRCVSILVVLAVLCGGLACLWNSPLRAKIPFLGGNAGLEEEAHAEMAAPAESLDITLSVQALKNIGLTDEHAILTLTPTTFGKTLSFPAMVTEYPGRSESKVPSPASGIITKIYHEPGVSASPGEPLFDITLTLQSVIEGQTQLLEMLKKREILEAEIQRVGELPEGLAPKTKRELEFQKSEIDLQVENQKSLLKVQGISEEALQKLLEKQEITRNVTVCVPPISHHGLVSEENPGEVKNWMIVRELFVEIGQMVALGDPLCTLCDLCELPIRGEAFAYDEPLLLKALQEKAPVHAIFEGTDGNVLRNLTLRSMDNHIDEQNRTIFCYIDFPNEVAVDRMEEQGEFPAPRRYIQWKYKPGQRCELEVEYARMENVFVLPTEAVAKEVNDTYVFEWVGTDVDLKIWRKKPVHVVYQWKDQTVIANDGSIFPRAKIAATGADFLLAALNAKNSGGTAEVDPHAGCSH
ncbi:MAG: efflux RND transporter periplasmic adaptor subunit [Planctomycetia bacterium]|nr:efflux RND transporter periplasmic adaptor subunit [Planctomycetia bacterium]